MFFGPLLLIGLGAIIVWLMREREREMITGGTTAGRSDAQEILRQRYARGEISSEEYQQMRRDLEQP